jgi:S1-C subfamily serine protease
VKLGAQPVSNRFDLERAFWGYAEGEKIEAVVVREGKETRLALTLCRDGDRTADARTGRTDTEP